MKYLLIIITLFMVGCNCGSNKKPKYVAKALCIHQCVKQFNLREANGDGILEIKKICQSKFKHLKCCDTGQYDYYSSCRR